MNIIIGPNEASQRLDKFLRKLLKDVPLSAIYKTIRKGDVKINGKKGKEKYSLCEGDEVEIRDIKTSDNKEEKRKELKKLQGLKTNFKVTYEDDNILLLEKWPGILVHSDKKDGDPTLTDHVLAYLHEKGEYTPEKEITFTPAPCNRLDRNTSGIVMFGKNFKALKDLNEMVRERGVEKYYVALVQGRIKDGIYKGHIVKDERSNLSRVFKDKVANSKEIAMEVKTIQSNGLFSFIELTLITGRSHQLRAHLASLGNPIIGDEKYGNKKMNSFFFNKFGLDYQFLYAYKVIFKECPEKLENLKNKTIAESLPPIFKKIKKDVFKF